MIYNFMIKTTHPSGTNVIEINFFKSSKKTLKVSVQKMLSVYIFFMTFTLIGLSQYFYRQPV